MGANCCVAVKNKHLPSPARFDVSTCGNIRHSPTWSFRWDNRTHIEDDVINNSAHIFQHHNRNAGTEIKSESITESESLSDRASPSNGFQLQKQHKSLNRIGISGKSRIVAADDQSDGSTSFLKKKGSPRSSYSVNASDGKLTISVCSTPSPSYKADPSSSRSHSLPSDATSSRKACRSPGYQLSRQISDSRLPSLHSLNENSSPEGRQSFVLSFRSNDLSTGGSHGGSSDGWSMRTFTELVASSNRERWSFDSDNLTYSSSKITSSDAQQTALVTPSQQRCRVCSKLLTEYCVVAVLVCGHLYHAECLDKLTSEIDRYDPPCPVCTQGEKSAGKLFKKAEAKVRNKLSRIGVADGDANGDAFCDPRNGASEGPKMGASSSMKSSFGKPFLRRHFSIGRPSRSSSENESTRKKGFWDRHQRES